MQDQLVLLSLNITNLSDNSYNFSEILLNTSSILNNETTTILATRNLNKSTMVAPTTETKTAIFESYSNSLIVIIPMTIIYSIIFISGLLGNIITCIVIVKNRSMHTATNYYLFSLAISDLLLLLSGLPLEIYETWFDRYPFDEVACILQGFSAETSANATVLTITAFTAERYIAICHPFLSHTMSKLSRAIKFIIGIWFLAMTLAVPQILDLGILSQYNTCGHKDNARKYVFTISSIVCFVLPMVIITVFYVLIGLQLRRSKIVGRATTANGNSIKLKPKNYRTPSTKRHILLTTFDKNEKINTLLTPEPSCRHNYSYHNHHQNHDNLIDSVCIENDKQNIGRKISNHSLDEGRKNYSSQRGYMGTRHVVNMLVAVVVAFFVCWAPHHAQRIFAMNADQKYAKIYDILTLISGILYYTSACINPFLYNIMSYKFREAFKETCAKCCYHSHQHHSHCHCKQRGNVNSFRNYCHDNGLSRNISQRSLSHNSLHTYSSICSIGPVVTNLNVLNHNIMNLKCTERPLVVSFKKNREYNRQPQQKQNQRQKNQHHRNKNDDDYESSSSSELYNVASYKTYKKPEKRTKRNSSCLSCLSTDSKTQYKQPTVIVNDCEEGSLIFQKSEKMYVPKSAINSRQLNDIQHDGNHTNLTQLLENYLTLDTSMSKNKKNMIHQVKNNIQRSQSASKLNAATNFNNIGSKFGTDENLK